MRFCKYCGNQISSTAEYCPACGRKIGGEDGGKVNASNLKTAFSRNKRLIFKGGAVLLIVIVAVFIMLSFGRCQADGCNRKAVAGMEYCYTHKCVIENCDEEKFSSSNFCYEHCLLYDDDAASYTSPVGWWELEISDVYCYSNGSYCVAEGKLTNNSEQTVEFVKIRGAFKSNSGKVIDTDWTYAVGDEGLRPTESCTWRMSVDHSYYIEDCRQNFGTIS